MYIPKHWHFAISTAISLLGFYIMHSMRKIYNVVTEDVWVLFFVLQYIAAVHVTWIYKAGQMYQAYITQWKAERVPEEEPIYNHHTGLKVEPIPVAARDGFTPLVRLKEQPVVLNQVVALPRFDKERSFAVTLVRMHEHTPDSADLTETKWVKSGKFARAEFKAMLEVWENHRVIRRKSEKKNAPYLVSDWRKVRLIAEGNPLPPPLK